ncbi:MAG: S-layer homology domain-containing protein [Lysinibacillus sp.]
MKTKEQQRLAMLLYVNGITKGVNATQFGPNKPVTRAQLCTFIYRIEQKIANGQLQLDGPVANLFVPANEQVISYVDLTGKAIENDQYVFEDYIPGQKILIHEAKTTGRYIVTTKNTLGVEKEYGVVTDYRNNQFRSYDGTLISSDKYTLTNMKLIEFLQENDTVEVLSVDVNETVKNYKKRVATFGNATIDEKITLPIIAEGHTVIQVVYKVANKTKTKNIHLAVYEMGNRYLVTNPLHVE